jgi:hypothetical protein
MFSHFLFMSVFPFIHLLKSAPKHKNISYLFRYENIWPKSKHDNLVSDASPIHPKDSIFSYITMIY